LIIVTLIQFGVFNKNKHRATNSDKVKVVEESSEDDSFNDSSEIDTEESKTDEKVTLKIKKSNSWKDQTSINAQYDVVITNNSTEQLNDWTVEIELPNGASIKQIWNATNAQNDNKTTFSPVTHNKVIAPNSSVDFGFIVSSSEELNLVNAKVIAGNYTASSSNAGTNTNSSGNNSSSGNDVITAANALEVPAPSTDDWLFAKGNKIVDANGKEVWITGVNWFGYNTGTNTFDGLWSADLNSSLQAIADKGFNMLRVPISAELILQWKNGTPPAANFNQATNSYLVGKDSLQIFDYVVGQCRANGLKIMIDIHSAETDASGHMAPMWYTSKISEKDYLDALAWMAKRYANDDTILAYDLKNEPHGKPNESPRAIWNNSKSADNWKYIAEKAAMAVLNNNPNVLVLVEGIEIYPKNIKTNGNYSSTSSSDYCFNWWGGNLRGVKDYPINLGKYQNKLVYSPHDYGPTVYQQPWFDKNYTFKSLYEDCWRDNWMFIYEDKIAPILIGEWGGYMSEPNIKWMTYLRQLIKENRLHHTFWCFNANSGDTGGLVLDDFKTWDTEKYNFVKEVLWQENGKFVGLDHKIPLGKNGKTLS
jgi:aryl-phospho-beta-D-glucosidase BglC (GH1 family)